MKPKQKKRQERKKLCWHQALAQLFSWLKHCPVHQKVADSIPSLGIYLHFSSTPIQSMYRKFPFTLISLSLFLSLSTPLSTYPCCFPSPFLSLKKKTKINEHSLRWELKNKTMVTGSRRSVVDRSGIFRSNINWRSKVGSVNTEIKI